MVNINFNLKIGLDRSKILDTNLSWKMQLALIIEKS